MAKTLTLPIDDLIETAEEAAQLCWDDYGLLIAEEDHRGDWAERARARFLQCTACDERVAELHALRERAYGRTAVAAT